jgi:hypothetical protein
MGETVARPRAGCAIDHLVAAARSLEEGADWLARRIGVAPQSGGRHALMGTHNLVLRLGKEVYLEIIAVDPAAEAPARPRWFELDRPAMRERIAAGPRLVAWVARCGDIDAAPAGCPAIRMQRGDLTWRITVPEDGGLPGGGLLPMLIQWETPFHPASRMEERGCRLERLVGFHPRPDALRPALDALVPQAGFELRACAPGEDPHLVAHLRTPAGAVVLR